MGRSVGGVALMEASLCWIKRKWGIFYFRTEKENFSSFYFKSLLNSRSVQLAEEPSAWFKDFSLCWRSFQKQLFREDEKKTFCLSFRIGPRDKTERVFTPQRTCYQCECESGVAGVKRLASQFSRVVDWEKKCRQFSWYMRSGVMQFTT